VNNKLDLTAVVITEMSCLRTGQRDF